jgi:alkylation response protein AidB-like acyl-CoA dehydrogenase
LLGLEYPETYGGAGADFVTTVVLWKELAEGDHREPRILKDE